MNLFPRKPVDTLTEWADAAAYAANGYAVLPLEKSWASVEPHPAVDALTHEAPMGQSHAWGLDAPVHGADEFTVAIQAGRLPREGAWSITECRASWLCCVKLAPMSKRQMRDALPLLAGSLIRTDTRNGHMLAVFRAGTVADPRDFGFDARTTHAEATGIACFLPRAPWLTWRDGCSPATVRRDELRPLTWDDAQDLFHAVDEVTRERAA
jgi:hypothetical protein